MQACKELCTVPSKGGVRGKKSIVWIDLSDPDCNMTSDMIDILRSKHFGAQVILLLTHTPDKCTQAECLIEELEFEKSFTVEPITNRHAAASSLHQEIKLRFSAPLSSILGQDLSLRVLEECIDEVLPQTDEQETFPHIADIFVDDDEFIFVRICVHDVCYLHSLRDSVLRDDHESFQKKLCQRICEKIGRCFDGTLVQVDKTRVAEIYGEGLLSLSELTPHQEERLQHCRDKGDCDLHIQAPAGAGKTFIALHLMQELLLSDCSEDVQVYIGITCVQHHHHSRHACTTYHIQHGDIVHPGHTHVLNSPLGPS
jgi:hypothetical protein